MITVGHGSAAEIITLFSNSGGYIALKGKPSLWMPQKFISNSGVAAVAEPAPSAQLRRRAKSWGDSSPNFFLSSAAKERKQGKIWRATLSLGYTPGAPVIGPARADRSACTWAGAMGWQTGLYELHANVARRSNRA